MSRIGLVEPATLLGQEILESWTDELPGHDAPILLTQRDEGIGTLTRSADSAGIVMSLASEDLESLDLLLCCDLRAEEAGFLDVLPPTVAAVVLAADGSASSLAVGVAGLEEGSTARRVLSAHPAVVAAAQILSPLDRLGLRSAELTALLPASMHSAEALDELLEQTRAILSFTPPVPGAIFTEQLAYNVVPASVSQVEIQRQLREVLGPLPVALQCLQAGVFHSIALSLHCRLSAAVTAAQVEAALTESPAIETTEQPQALGPIRAAGRRKMIVGDVVPSGVEGGFWVWAVVDNLTRGGALNALGIARRILAG